MTCPSTRAVSDRFWLGEDLGELSAHALTCSACRAALEQLRSMVAPIAASAAPEGLADRVLAGLPGAQAARVRRERPPKAITSHGSLVLRTAAAAALIVAVLGLGIGAAVLWESSKGAVTARPSERRERPPAVRVEPAARPRPSLGIQIPERLLVGDRFETALALHWPGEGAIVTDFELLAPEGLLIEPSHGRMTLTAGERRDVVVQIEAWAPVEGAVSARLAGDTAAAVTLPVRVETRGREISLATNLVLLGQETRLKASLPSTASELVGPRSVALRCLPSVAAEAVLGLNGLVTVPHGCFEQTTAATFPNVLILKIEKQRPDADSAAVARIHGLVVAGAERLRNFQHSDGSFSLHGNGKPDPWLTAVGLAELAALSELVPIEPWRIERAAEALVGFQMPDGSFPRRGRETAGPVAVTAYAARALLLAGEREAAEKSLAWLEQAVGASESVYEWSLAALAFELSSAHQSELSDLAKRISTEARRTSGLEGGSRAVEHLSWAPEATLTTSRARRPSADSLAVVMEVTALASQALAAAGELESAMSAVRWIEQARQGRGFAGTQATVRMLEALARVATVRGGGAGHLDVWVGGLLVFSDGVGGGGLSEWILTAPSREAEAVFTDALQFGVELRFRGSGRLPVQIVASGQRGWGEALEAQEGRVERDLRISVEMTPLELGSTATWAALVSNEGVSTVPSPLVDLDLPAGVALLDGRWPRGDGLLHSEIHRGRLILYLADLAPGAETQVTFEVVGAYLGVFLVEPPRVYAYYAEETEALAPAPAVQVSGRREPALVTSRPESRPVQRPPERIEDTEDRSDSASAADVRRIEASALDKQSIVIGWDVPQVLDPQDLTVLGSDLNLLVGRAVFVSLGEMAAEKRSAVRSVDFVLRARTWGHGDPVSADDFVLSWQRSREALANSVRWRDPEVAELVALADVRSAGFNVVSITVPWEKKIAPVMLLFESPAFRAYAAADPAAPTPSSSGMYGWELDRRKQGMLHLVPREPGLRRIRIVRYSSYEPNGYDLIWRRASGAVYQLDDEFWRTVDLDSAVNRALSAGGPVRIRAEHPDHAKDLTSQLESKRRAYEFVDHSPHVTVYEGEAILPRLESGGVDSAEEQDPAGYVLWPLKCEGSR